MTWAAYACAVVVLLIVVLRARRRRRRRVVPSHSPGYDALHRSYRWRKVINGQVYARSHGRCEARWCRRRVGLQKHLTSYACLSEGRWPRLDEIRHLCPKHHHRADDKRRAHQ